MSKSLKRFAAIALLALGSLSLGGCFSVVDTGNVGVKKFQGQVDPKPLEPGFHLTWFTSVTEVIVKEVPMQLNDMRPQTSDKITLSDLDVDIYVSANPSKVAEIFTKWPGDLTKIDGDYAVGLNFIGRQAREAVYNVVSKHHSSTVHAERSALAGALVKLLQTDIDASAGPGLFTVRSANIRNLVTDPALEGNIRAAANREYEIKSKEKEVQLAKLEAERQREEAKGVADAIRIKAEAVSKQGGSEYVQLEWIKKWNGQECAPGAACGNTSAQTMRVMK